MSSSESDGQSTRNVLTERCPANAAAVDAPGHHEPERLAYNAAGMRRCRAVAQAEIIIADERLLPQAVEIYNQIFRPRHEADYFKRRFMGRYNVLTLLARLDERPVGFWIGFELKPGMFYHWLGGVIPELRRQGIGRQLQEAQHAWARDHGYEYIRCECLNHQREFLHFAVSTGYDVVGIRWDSTHADNLIVLERSLLDQ